MTQSIKSRNITTEMRTHFVYELMLKIFKPKVTAVAKSTRHKTKVEMEKALNTALKKSFPKCYSSNPQHKAFVELWGTECTTFSNGAVQEAISKHPVGRTAYSIREKMFNEGYHKRDHHKFSRQARALEMTLFRQLTYPALDSEWKCEAQAVPKGIMLGGGGYYGRSSIQPFNHTKVISKGADGQADPNAPIIYALELAKPLADHVKAAHWTRPLEIANEIVADALAIQRRRIQCFELARQVWDGVSFYKTTKQLKEGWPEVYEYFMEVNNLNVVATKELAVNPVDVHALSRKLAEVQA